MDSEVIASAIPCVALEHKYLALFYRQNELIRFYAKPGSENTVKFGPKT